MAKFGIHLMSVTHFLVYLLIAKALEFFEDILRNNLVTNDETNESSSLTNLFMKQNYFKIKCKPCEQQDETAMGIQFSPFLSKFRVNSKRN